MAASLTTMASHTANPITTSGVDHCAPAARSPSLAAASQPWAKSSTQSILCVLSASSSLTKAPSKSRMTSPTATAALSNSSVRLHAYCLWKWVWDYMYMWIYVHTCLMYIYKLVIFQTDFWSCHNKSDKCLLAVTPKGLLWMSDLFTLLLKMFLPDPKRFLFRILFLCVTVTKKERCSFPLVDVHINSYDL